MLCISLAFSGQIHTDGIAIAIGILLIAAGCATAYGIKSRKTTKGDADESAEDNTEA